MLHETDGLRITEESGNYSAGRMMQVWPSRFKTIEAALPFAHNAEKLFNNVYANRMGNGAPESGDGYRYRGRGILQTTGRGAYREYGRRCGIDFEAHPELILSSEHALKPALAEWSDGKCNALADAGDIRAITRKINGGLTGYENRCAWLRRVEKLIGGANIGFTPRSSVTASLAEKPKSAAATVVGAAAAAGSLAAAVVPATSENNQVGFWVFAALGAAALVVVGLALLWRHHLAVKMEG